MRLSSGPLALMCRAEQEVKDTFDQRHVKLKLRLLTASYISNGTFLVAEATPEMAGHVQ